eukprot:1032579-Rhodomonas_salina.2
MPVFPTSFERTGAIDEVESEKGQSQGRETWGPYQPSSDSQVQILQPVHIRGPIQPSFDVPRAPSSTLHEIRARYLGGAQEVKAASKIGVGYNERAIHIPVGCIAWLDLHGTMLASQSSFGTLEYSDSIRPSY